MDFAAILDTISAVIWSNANTDFTRLIATAVAAWTLIGIIFLVNASTSNINLTFGTEPHEIAFMNVAAVTLATIGVSLIVFDKICDIVATTTEPLYIVVAIFRAVFPIGFGGSFYMAAAGRIIKESLRPSALQQDAISVMYYTIPVGIGMISTMSNIFCCVFDAIIVFRGLALICQIMPRPKLLWYSKCQTRLTWYVLVLGKWSLFFLRGSRQFLSAAILLLLVISIATCYQPTGQERMSNRLERVDASDTRRRVLADGVA